MVTFKALEPIQVTVPATTPAKIIEANGKRIFLRIQNQSADTDVYIGTSASSCWIVIKYNSEEFFDGMAPSSEIYAVSGGSETSVIVWEGEIY